MQLVLTLVLSIAPFILLWILGVLLPLEGPVSESESIAQAYYRLVIIVVGTMAVIIPAIILTGRAAVIRPLSVIADKARSFSAGVPLPIRESFAVKEIDEVAHSVNDMMETVLNREDVLRSLNESLEDRVRERTAAHERTIETLQSAQSQLILSEKMAVLGSLVTGVAHEINTPMSIGVTAASFLNERTRSMLTEWEKQVLTQEDFERFLKDADEASRIIQSNIDQATRIINSLKQVAADQQVDERREFELGSYMDDVLLSLKHQMRSGKHVIEATTDGVIMMDSYPGALTQVLNNLVFNSITHGFADKEGGRVSIRFSETDGEVTMHYHDDGRGLTDEERDRIFDQFYTTRRGRGGTGLGMNIVRDLVVNTLQGSIEIEPPSNGGVGFTVRFPAAAETDRVGEGE
jgi:signal transduction histidine kinase